MKSHTNKNLSQFLNKTHNKSDTKMSIIFDGDHNCTAGDSLQSYFQKQLDKNQRIINAQMRHMKENKAYLMTMQQRNTSLQGTSSGELDSMSLQDCKNTAEGQEQTFTKQRDFVLQKEYAHQCLAEFAPMLKSFFGGDDDKSTASVEEESLSDADASRSLPENANSSIRQGQEGNTSNEGSSTSSTSNVGRQRKSKIKYSDPTVDSSARGEQKKAIPAKRRKKPKDMPRRPLSGYNLFFKDERARILVERDERARDGSDQKVGFERLAQLIGQRWKALSDNDKTPFKVRADEDTQRYRREMIVYKEKLLAEEAESLAT
jgi:hypothetical protein